MTDGTSTETRRAPKWALEKIGYLERDLAEAQATIARLSEGPANSNVIAHDYVNPDRLLGRNIMIRFLLDDRGSCIEAAHDRSGGGYLILRAVGDIRAAQSLSVQPAGAVNTVRVRLEESW